MPSTKGTASDLRARVSAALDATNEALGAIDLVDEATPQTFVGLLDAQVGLEKARDSLARDEAVARWTRWTPTSN
jgi:hypothetical protein